MLRVWLFILTLFLAVGRAFGQADDTPIEQKPWFVVHTTHFNIYSCGNARDTYRLAGQLEQFCRAYSVLAGADAVASPPIVVLAFPDHDSMKPFLPLYNGQPGNIAGFFTRGSDENLIVLSLPSTDSPDMDVIFHEYAHLLFRRNDEAWPLWLKEGMAEIYSTFKPIGNHVEIARPIDRHLDTLANEDLMPLDELFSVGRGSPQYNEATRQGMFYAESWLLTHYLMAGDNAILRERFARFTPLLKQGQSPEQAFTNALGVSLGAMQAELQRYAKAGHYSAIVLKLNGAVGGPVTISSLPVTPVEILYRFGDEQLHIGRLDSAELWFKQAQKLAPASPLPYEGLALLAQEQDNHSEALSDLDQAMKLGSASYVAHYLYAEEKYHQTSQGGEMYGRIEGDSAAEIRGELVKSIAMMPSFGPAHELLGFFEMVQGDNLATAEQQLQMAIALEPENQAYQFTLAQVQLSEHELDAARRTLQPLLLLPNVDPKLKANAQTLSQQINGAN
jgi:tetratricopeptide (TPR) repeat protein